MPDVSFARNGASKPAHVRIVDVTPRDGLQNQPVVLSAEQRAALIRRLYESGVPQIEVGSFVRADRVPQMADVEKVVAALPAAPDSERFTALVPNHRAYQRAAATGLRHLRSVVAASAEMNRRNFGVDPGGTMREIAQMLTQAAADGVTINATISTAFGCPYEGRVAPETVVALAQRLAEGGAAEILLADTTGIAVPPQVADVVGRARDAVAPVPVGVHFHNTRNAGYANAFAALDAGAVTFDASLGGIGGCPFAPKATGNIATEDLVHMFERADHPTAIALDRLLEAVVWLEEALGAPVPGLVQKAGAVDAAVYHA